MCRRLLFYWRRQLQSGSRTDSEHDRNSFWDGAEVEEGSVNDQKRCVTAGSSAQHSAFSVPLSGPLKLTQTDPVNPRPLPAVQKAFYTKAVSSFL